MYNEGTIIALSSAPGSGAIAIIRLSGKDAISKTDLFLILTKNGNMIVEIWPHLAAVPKFCY